MEDHPGMRRMVKQLVEAQPDFLVVGEVASGEDALALLASSGVDLTLVDLSMSGMSGLQLLQRLHEEHPSVRCVVLSGHIDAIYVDAAIAAHARGYVSKADPGEVVAAIRHALRGDGVYLSEGVRGRMTAGGVGPTSSG